LLVDGTPFSELRENSSILWIDIEDTEIAFNDNLSRVSVNWVNLTGDLCVGILDNVNISSIQAWVGCALSV